MRDSRRQRRARVTALRLACVTALLLGTAGAQEPAQPLPFPGLLAREEREAGNPLATYAAMLEFEPQYLKSPLAGVYPEVRANFEEFLGLPFAGKEAMALPSMTPLVDQPDEHLPRGLHPLPALGVILGAARQTRLVIFGEEHHLPQTRCLYEPLLRGL